MKTLGKILAGIGLIGATLLPMKEVNAQETDSLPAKPKISFDTNGRIVNETRFWGLPFLDSPMYSQALNLNKGGLSVSMIGNLDVENRKLFDIDVLVNYVHPISDNLVAYVGNLSFLFNIGEGWNSAALSYGGLAANLPLNPSITYNRLSGFVSGEYVEGALSKSFQIGNSELNSSVKIGYNDNALRVGKGFSHIETEVSTPISVNNSLTITPHIKYTHPFIPSIKKGYNLGLDVNLKLKRSKN